VSDDGAATGRFGTVERQLGSVTATLETLGVVQEKQATEIARLHTDLDRLRRGSEDGDVSGINQLRHDVRNLKASRAAEKEEQERHRVWLTRTIIAWAITTAGSVIVGVLIALSGTSGG